MKANISYFTMEMVLVNLVLVLLFQLYNKPMDSLNLEYRENGFLILTDFWNTDELDRVHSEAKEIFYSQMKEVIDAPQSILADSEAFDHAMFRYFKIDTEGFINCGKQAQHLVSLHRLSVDDRLIRLLHDLGLSFPVISVRPSMFFNSRNLDNTGHYWRLDAHQDWRSSQGSLDSVTLWFPYVNCNNDLGALQIIPKSHLGGLLNCEKVDYYSKIKDPIDESKYVSVEMNKGDLLIFSSFLVHRSGTNNTSRIRWSTQLRYSNLNESTFIDRKFPNPFIYKPYEDLVTTNFPSNEQLSKVFLNS
jgi:phytanoyl-CoA hydroxylase